MYRIDYHFVIKVADFGLSESINTSKQYFRQDEKVVVKLPIKWLAPESINESVFSEKTDVVIWCTVYIDFAISTVSKLSLCAHQQCA